MKRKLAPNRIALGWIGIWALSSLIAGVLYSAEFDLSQVLAPPSWSQGVGTDAFGRNLLALTLKASATSCGITLLALLATVVFALIWGMTAFALPASLKKFNDRILETTLAVPSLLLALTWSAIRGPGWDTLIISMMIGSVPSLTRLILARSRELWIQDYVVASVASGATPLQTVWTHLTPGILDLIRVKLPFLFTATLLKEATLSFLGVGAPIGGDTWGSLLAQADDYLLEAPQIAIVSGIPLVLTVVALQILSDRK